VQERSWYGVRCLFRHELSDGPTFEERITLWQANSFEEAIAKAEAEADEFAAIVDGERVDLAQAYLIDRVDGNETLGEGAEVFSLMRDSVLPSDAYVDRFFDTGDERQGTTSGT
jgi:hypothetical protein